MSSGGFAFPRDTTPSFFRAVVDGEAKTFFIKGFPQDENSFLDDIAELKGGKYRKFFAKIHSHVGGNTYRLVALDEYLKGVPRLGGELLTGFWLKPRSYEPPMLVGQWVVAGYEKRKRVVFTGKNPYSSFLGDVRMYQGTAANVPTGWYLCNDTNDGTVKNGITVANLEDKFIVASGLRDGDTYDVGDTGGDTTHLHQVSLSGSYFDWKHSHGGVVAGAEDTDDMGDTQVGPWANSGTYETSAPRSTTGPGYDLLPDWHLPPYYALAFIVFTGV